jgi:hypothetical protein
MTPKSISATSLKLYESCPFCWKLKYVVGLMQPETPALLIGKMFHKSVEMYHNEIAPDKILAKIKEEMIKDKTDEEIDNFGVVRKAFELYCKYPIKKETVDTEYQFMVYTKGNSIPIIGFIDRVLDGGIIEYKTTSVDYTDEDTQGIQPLIYSYAYFIKYKKIPVITYYVVNKKKLKDPNYEPQIITLEKVDDFDKLENRVNEFVSNVSQNKFEPIIGHNCFMCPFRKYCKYATKQSHK